MRNEVNIMIGRFQPFTKGHMKCIERVYKKLHIPTIICMIDTKKSDEKHPFLSSIIFPIYKDIFKENKMIKDIILVNNANIVSIGQTIHDMGLVIRSWSCGTDRIDAYTRMSNNYHDKSFLPDNFEMVEIKRTDENISATKVRQALIDNDKKTFDKMTPFVPLHTTLKYGTYFNILRKEILKLQ